MSFSDKSPCLISSSRVTTYWPAPREPVDDSREKSVDVRFWHLADIHLICNVSVCNERAALSEPP
jgi:hypothetical protein